MSGGNWARALAKNPIHDPFDGCEYHTRIGIICARINGNGLIVPTLIRLVLAAWHRIIARVPIIARGYLALLRSTSSVVNAHRRQQILNSIGSTRWPEQALGPRSVILGNDTEVRLYPHNGEFDFQAILGGHMPYETEIFHFLDSRAQEYDVVIEIGANVGVFTVYLARQLQASGGKVYAFEPSAEAFARLVVLLEVLDGFQLEIDAAVREAAPDYRRYAITPEGLLAQEFLQPIGGRDCFLIPGLN